MNATSCPRCRWLGTANEECPSCGALVQPLRQKGLDGLRREYGLLLKPGYYPPPGTTREDRRAQIENFFECINQPICTAPDSTSSVINGKIERWKTLF